MKERKPRLDLLPARPLFEVTRAFEAGLLAGYRVDGWKSSDMRSYRKYLAKIMRHVLLFLSGEDCAKDSGVHHIAHAVADGLILLHHYLEGTGTDDRTTNVGLPRMREPESYSDKSVSAMRASSEST